MQPSRSRMNSISLKLDHKRYFTNPVEHDPDVLAKYCTDQWLEDVIQSLATRITNRQIIRDECENSGPYTGCGGIGFALLKAAQSCPERLQTYVQACSQLLGLQFAHAGGASKSRHTRYLCGTLGLYTIQAICDHMAGRSIKEFEDKFAKFVDIVCTEGYQRFGDDDILNGRAGFLLAVQMLRTETGAEVIPNSEIRRVMSALITSGRLYSRRNRSAAPLFYEWHHKEYLGAAHGISGILQALLTFWELLTEDEKTDVKQTLDWFVGIQSPDGNFPSSSGYVDYPKGEEELVHWCHGAPGVVHLLLTAVTVLAEEKYLQAAKRCVDLIWHRGLLRKGPGLCHGVSGNAYSFLLLYRLVSDPELLQRAKSFAILMMDPSFEEAANTPDTPYSLFEGWAGALCFLVDLRNPVRAQFPLLPIRFPS